MSPPFAIYRLTCGDLAHWNDGPRNSSIAAWVDGHHVLPQSATHFGIVIEGSCEIEAASGSFRLDPGMYFSIPGSARVGGAGSGVVISSERFRGFFHLGGPVESKGRLRYIDGCSDSVLIPPVTKGDPCMNLLVIPPGTNQTVHTHPSHRIGIVLSGRGTCRTPDGDFPLAPNMPWGLAAGAPHSFHTASENLRIVAFHPDSDFGPTDDDHPMLNRTHVSGNSLRRSFA